MSFVILRVFDCNGERKRERTRTPYYVLCNFKKNCSPSLFLCALLHQKTYLIHRGIVFHWTRFPRLLGLILSREPLKRMEFFTPPRWDPLFLPGSNEELSVSCLDESRSFIKLFNDILFGPRGWEASLWSLLSPIAKFYYPTLHYVSWNVNKIFLR